MVLSEEQIKTARELLQSSERTLFFHDDDPDGVCSFALLYQYTGQGMSVCVKNSPCLGEEYLRKVEENGPDLVVILDKPQVEEEFFDSLDLPVLWIDHHEPQNELTKRYPNVTYLNPRVNDDLDNRPTAYWSYLIAEKGLWIATIGTVGDWFLPPFLRELRQEYPDLIERMPETVEQLYLGTKIGELVRVLQFNLKGPISEVRKSVMTFTRVEDPYEILNQSTSRGKYLWRKYRKLAAPYEALLEDAVLKAEETEEKLFLYIYENDEQSFTSELSNELLIRYPEKVLIIGRHHDEKNKCSVRSKNVSLPDKIKTSIEGLEGHGGGHEHACGLVVADKDWELFLERFGQLLKDELN